MNYDETIKLAYGIGCISTLRQNNVDPVAFCKQAAVSGDQGLLKMANAVASVYNYSETQPDYAEKVASVVFEKEANPMALAKRQMGGMDGLMDAFRTGTAGRQAGHSMGDMRGMLDAQGVIPTGMQNAAMGAGRYAPHIAAGAAGAGAAGAAGYGAHQAMQPPEPSMSNLYGLLG